MAGLTAPSRAPPSAPPGTGRRPPPSGHAGGRALDRCPAACGGFDHNAQTRRVVPALEKRYPAFEGLNLSWEPLEGLVKHKAPLTLADGSPIGLYRERGLPHAIAL